jgi:hypothetical protein
MPDILHPSKWAKPIADFRDFSSFVATPIAIEAGKQHLFETKDSTEPSGYRLRAKVRMTFAGIRTRNKAVYLPDEHYKSAITFIKPYPKPIQLHHQDDRDPIGRVIDVRYIDTTNEAVNVDSRVGGIMKVFKDSKAKPIARLGTIPTFLSMSQNNQYRGVGHILGLWDVTDPDAIRKILDGRYLTVSTGMAPRSAYCSACALQGELIDWARQVCEHEPGEIVDGVECVKVPMNYDWEEVSPVNHPAAQLAQIIEVGNDITFADAIQKNQPIAYPLFEDCFAVKNDTVVRLTDSANVDADNLFDWTNVNKLDNNANTPHIHQANVIGEMKQDRGLDQKGLTMKLTELTKDTASNYEAIAKHLDGAARLTGDLLKDLEDSVFIGPNRTFPVRDLKHAEAIKSLLEEIEDSDSKAAILESLTDKVTALTSPGDSPAEESTEVSVEDSAAPTDETNDLVSITKDALAVYEANADKLSDLTTERDILKQRVASLKAEVQSLTAAQADTLKAYKSMLADALVDAQISHGFKIEDKVETARVFTERSIDSLRNSLQDLKAQAVNGAARKPTGERVEDPRTADSADTKERVEAVDRNKYKVIFETFYDKYYGPEGPSAAKRYLQDARAKGLIPANVQP